MSDAITTAIEGAMAEAGLTETSASGELTETVDSGTTLEASGEATGATGEAAAADEGESAAAGAEGTVETQEEKAAREATEAEDTELTIKPGENAIPHGRVKKMVSKAEARGRAAAGEVIKSHATEIERLKPYEAEYRRLNQLADQDPERMIEALAVANPAKWKPIQARLAGAPQVTSKTGAPAEGSTAGAPRPKPDFKLPDGSMTYSDEGLDKLLQWTTDQAVAKATERFEARLDPYEKERRATEFNRQQQPRIKAQIATAKERWGDLFQADYDQAESGKPSEILTYMNTNRVSFEDACTAVLLPKERARLKADRTAMRQELIKEMNERPAAASGGARAQVKTPAGPRTIEQTIADSMAAAGLT